MTRLCPYRPTNFHRNTIEKCIQSVVNIGVGSDRGRLPYLFIAFDGIWVIWFLVKIIRANSNSFSLSPFPSLSCSLLHWVSCQGREFRSSTPPTLSLLTCSPHLHPPPTHTITSHTHTSTMLWFHPHPSNLTENSPPTAQQVGPLAIGKNQKLILSLSLLPPFI